MDKIARMRQEIERRITDNTFGAKLELIDILALLDSLSEEPDNDDLNEEIKWFIEKYGYERGGDRLLIAIVARHFAEWGAEHLRDTTKMIDKSLEEYASRAGFDYVDGIVQEESGHRWNDHDVEFAYRDGIIAGAEWQKSQMLKDAVEGVVYRYESYKRIATAIIVDIPRDMLGNKVKLIIVKEEGE